MWIALESSLEAKTIEMARKKVTFVDVRRSARELPGVIEGTAYGSPALKVGKELLACIPTHRSAEADSLAVRVGFEQRESLLAEAPDVYYLKEHYVNYPVVLVRLNCIHPDALRELLRSGWNFVTTKKRRKPAKRLP